VTVTTHQALGPARLADYVRSMSWVAALAAPVRTAMIERVERLVATGTPDSMPVHAVMLLAARD
jgi:hypothetical protein